MPVFLPRHTAFLRMPQVLYHKCAKITFEVVGLWQNVYGIAEHAYYVSQGACKIYMLPLFIMQLSATAVTNWLINSASFLSSSLKFF